MGKKRGAPGASGLRKRLNIYPPDGQFRPGVGPGSCRRPRPVSGASLYSVGSGAFGRAGLLARASSFRPAFPAACGQWRRWGEPLPSQWRDRAGLAPVFPFHLAARARHPSEQQYV